MSETPVDIVDRPEAARYVARINGEEVGRLEYRRAGPTIILRHTEVTPASQRQGIAGQIVRFALDRARADGNRVIPRCPYVRWWIEHHADYPDLVAAARG
jgi:predicted GNAT family acetyltransferase